MSDDTLDMFGDTVAPKAATKAKPEAKESPDGSIATETSTIRAMDKPDVRVDPKRLAKIRGKAAVARLKKQGAGTDKRFVRLSRDMKRILLTLIKEGSLTTTEVATMLVGLEQFYSMTNEERKIQRNTVRKTMAKLEERGLAVSDDVPNKAQRTSHLTGEVETGVFGTTKSYRLAPGAKQGCMTHL